MVNNLVSVITKELGIGIGEEFYINDCTLLIYRLTDGGLDVRDADSDDWRASVTTVNNLIKGKITPLPFNPQEGQHYWTYMGSRFTVCETMWKGLAADYARKAAGIIFRSELDALKALPTKYKELTGKEWSNER